MKIRTLAVLLALFTAGAVHAQGGIKPGLWETRIVRMLVNGEDMVPQTIAAWERLKKSQTSIPPEQRKKMEALLTQGSGDPLTRPMCISADMAARDHVMIPRPPRAECESPKLTRSGNHINFEMVCKQDGRDLTGKGEVVFAGDQVTTKMETVGTNAAGARQNMVVETRMKFLRSDCGQVLPLDQSGGEAPAKPGTKK